MNGYPPPPAYTSASQRTVTEDPQEQEVELYESYKEREAYDNLADLYAIILATEHLERAYSRDAITREEVSADGTVDSYVLSAESYRPIGDKCLCTFFLSHLHAMLFILHSIRQSAISSYLNSVSPRKRPLERP